DAMHNLLKRPASPHGLSPFYHNLLPNMAIFSSDRLFSHIGEVEEFFTSEVPTGLRQKRLRIA
ncbi:hypothetical protein, partial [Phormidium sp. CCY1219]|uniref:hypothetical protein n=1 Tax=Phormidium sp. CCY1219 TaxID=2886104 RepID=UPI002D1E8C81